MTRTSAGQQSLSGGGATADSAAALWIGFVGYCDPTSTDAAGAYEDAMLALWPRYAAHVVVRGRRRHDQPTNLPAELHVLWFPSRDAFDAFSGDPTARTPCPVR